jgi:tetratricopeptide (TPR) repeat protein
MGVVYEGRAKNGARAAVKVLRPQLLANPEQVARIYREARSMGQVRHPNVVPILDAGQGRHGHVYLALELVEGPSLQSWLEEHGPMGERARSVAGDLFRGLAAVHAAGIVHRDVKPGNILRSSDGHWKLSDFGLSRREGGRESLNLTRPEIVLGTPLYMAPEQCRGQRVDARTDLYAAGTTLYQAIAGKPPLARGSIAEILAAQMSEIPPALDANVSADLAHVVSWCLEKKPDDRPQSAKAVLAFLNLPLEARAKSATTPERSESGRSSTARGPLARARLRIVAFLSRNKDPGRAAEALSLLGNHAAAADLFAQAGRLADSGYALRRAGDALAAGDAFERANEPQQALDAFIAAGSFERAARAALELALFQYAGQLFARVERWDDALAAFRKAHEPLAAAQVLERSGRPRDAADELASALLDPRRPLGYLSGNDSQELQLRIASLYDAAGDPKQSAPFLEAAGKLAMASQRYEQSGLLAKAAETASKVADFGRAASLFDRAGLRLDACRARAEWHLEHADPLAAAAELEAAGEHSRAVSVYEKEGALKEAVRAAEHGELFSKAADIFMRLGDPRRAGPYFEKTGAYVEAARCYRGAEDPASEARVLELAGDPLAAARAWIHAGKDDEARRLIASLPKDDPGRIDVESRLKSAS